VNEDRPSSNYKSARECSIDAQASEYDDYEEYDDYDDADDEESGICPDCSGSGEGLNEGTTCRTCKGKGES
jgi:hypothetical protein